MALSIATAAVGLSTPALHHNAASSRTSGLLMADGMSNALPFLKQPAHLDGSMAGDQGFDPLGLGSAGDLRWMREAEVKHGRVCMLAVIGYVAVDLGLYAPGAPKVSSLLAHDVTVKTGHMILLLGFIGMLEALSYPAISEMMNGETDRKPGDYGFDPLNYSKNKDKLPHYELAEITHCRAAMLGFAGIITQSALKEVGFPYF